MKKKILAFLFLMLMCLFSLTACVETEEKVSDTEITDSLNEGAEQLVGQIVAMDEATVDQYIEEYYGVGGISPDPGLLSGLESWKNSRDELGAYVSYDSGEVVYDTENRQYVLSASLSFEKRSCEFRLIVNRKMDEIQSMTFNPDYTFGEKMAKAAMNTVTGIGTVFVMLILISVIIYCFKFIHQWEENRSKANTKTEAAPVIPAAPAAAEEEPEEEDLTDDLELVAVITAAIAASEETVSADGLVVRSIRRVPASKWKRG